MNHWQVKLSWSIRKTKTEEQSGSIPVFSISRNLVLLKTPFYWHQSSWFLFLLWRITIFQVGVVTLLKLIYSKLRNTHPLIFYYIFYVWDTHLPCLIDGICCYLLWENLLLIFSLILSEKHVHTPFTHPASLFLTCFYFASWWLQLFWVYRNAGLGNWEGCSL